MSLEIIRKQTFKKVKMTNNICQACGAIIYPGEHYFTDGMMCYCENCYKLEVE